MSPLPFPLIPGRSAHDSLSLWSDGPVPIGWWDMAHAHDAAHPPKGRPARIRPASLRARPEVAIRIMAMAMEKAAARQGCITRDELLALGLKPAEVDAHAAAAFRLALARTPGLAALLGEAA